MIKRGVRKCTLWVINNLSPIKNLNRITFLSRRFKFDFQKTLVNLAKKDQFKIIVIGANDGLSFDNLFNILDPNNTEGLAIEPSPIYFQRLKNNLQKFGKLQFLQAALFNVAQETVLYQLNQKGLSKLPDWGSGIGSFDKNHLLRFGVDDTDIEEVYVQGITFSEVLNQYPKYTNIDYLQIDTEGFDANILQMIDFTKFHVSIIKFEWANLTDDERKRSRNLLIAHQFHVVIGGEDAFGIHNSIRQYYK